MVTSRETWDRRILQRLMLRVRTLLTGPVWLRTFSLSRQGEIWQVRLTGHVTGPGKGGVDPDCRGGGQAAGGASPAVGGVGLARLQAHWLPGDPRISRRLRRAVADAVAQLVERSGTGLRVFRRRAPGTGSGNLARRRGLRRERASCSTRSSRPPSSAV